MRLPCPWCGLRDVEEFRYGGAAGVLRPNDPVTVDDAAWADYLFYRDNPRGPHRERWVHAWGCRQWFVVERDTVTHAVLRSGPEVPPRPAGEEPA